MKGVRCPEGRGGVVELHVNWPKGLEISRSWCPGLLVPKNEQLGTQKGKRNGFNESFRENNPRTPPSLPLPQPREGRRMPEQSRHMEQERAEGSALNIFREEWECVYSS